MADYTEISWTDSTWNPITGCSIKSPGCTNCYAMGLAGTRLKHHPSRAGLTREVNGKHVWTGEVRFNEQWLDQPLRWKAPRDIFVVAHGDLAYEKVPDDWLDQVFSVMILGHQHRFQVLTKRADRLLEYLSQGRPLYDRILTVANRLRRQHPGLRLGDVPVDDPALGAFHRNIWIGTSVERQQEADERRPHLEALARMGWNTWVSYEPALGPVDWSGWEFARWMVSGGESGPDARPSHPDWFRSLRDQCASVGVPYFHKQNGEYLAKSQDARIVDGTKPWGTIEPDGSFFPLATPWNGHDDDGLGAGAMMVRVGKKAAGALLDGVEHRAMPRTEGNSK